MPPGASNKAPAKHDTDTQLALLDQKLDQVGKDQGEFRDEFKKFQEDWKRSCDAQESRLRIQETATNGLQIIVDNHKTEIDNLRRTNSIWSVFNTLLAIVGGVLAAIFGMKN